MKTVCETHLLGITPYVQGEVDVAKELAKLQKKADAAERAISGLEKKFSNPNFAKASEDVQAKDKEKVGGCGVRCIIEFCMVFRWTVCINVFSCPVQYEAKKAELAQIRESMEWFKALE